MRNRETAKWHKNEFSLEVGQHLRKGETVFRITEKHGAHLKLEHVVSLESKLIEEQVLVKQYLDGALVPCSEEDLVRAHHNDKFEEDDLPATVQLELSSMSDAARAAGDKKIKYIMGLHECGHTSLRPSPLLDLEVERLRKQFGDLTAPKVSTLYTASLAIDAQGGDLRAAYPRYSERGGQGKSRLSPQALRAFEESIENLKRNPKARISYKEIADDVRTRLIEEVGQSQAFTMQPSLSTIERETKKTLTAYEICVRNEGKKAADKKYARWTPRDRATSPLETVEFDDKDSRVYGIDDKTGLPVGRVHVTSGIDQFSQMPLGFSISDQPRNVWSAVNTFANCILPKDLSHPDYSDVSGSIPLMGNMGIAIFDNALYNHSNQLEASIGDMSNSIVAFSKPFTPREKSVIEDFNGRMVAGIFSTMDGFLGPKDSRDFLAEGQAAANMSVAEFRKRFLKWTYDVYCLTPRANGLTPMQMWEMGMVGRKLRIPSDVNRVLLATMLPKEVRLRSELIQFTGLIYQNHRLESLRRRIGYNAEIKFKYHPQNLEKIFVFDALAKEWFEVPSANLEYTKNLSLYQHRIIRKKAREAGANNPSIPVLMKHRAELATLVAQLRISKKLRDRKLANRVRGENGFTAPQSTLPTLVMTELEAKVTDIEDVEMDSSDEGWDFPAL